MNMRMMRRLVALGIVLAFPSVGSAVPVTYDEVLIQSTGDSAKFFGTIDMSYAGSALTIILTNTSLTGADTEASGNLLTGIAFNLPTAVSLGGGKVELYGSSTASSGYNAPASGDVSPEWGYDGNPLKSGGFLGLALNPTNTAISSMESQVTDQFASGSLFKPKGLNGPSGGLLSSDQTPFGGMEYITDSVKITLNLLNIDQALGGSLVAYIDANPVVLSFGSPNTPMPRNRVPEPGTLFLLGSGLLSLGWARRRKQSA